MNSELTDSDQASNALRLSLSLRRQRWAILATGLACSALLIVFLFGALPGVPFSGGLGASIGVSFGAAFLVAAGIGSWWVWTRAADFLTRRVVLTDRGIMVEFVNRPPVHLDWADAGLRFSVIEVSDPISASGGTIRWGSGGVGRSARVSGSGLEALKAQAVSQGLKAYTTLAGKPPNQWSTTVFSRT